MLELGRYNPTTTNNRHCPLCGSNQIKLDEAHFLFYVFYILYDYEY